MTNKVESLEAQIFRLLERKWFYENEIAKLNKAIQVKTKELLEARKEAEGQKEETPSDKTDKEE